MKVISTNSTFKFVYNLPITYSCIYSIGCCCVYSNVANDSNPTGHRVSWATSGVLHSHTTSNITIAYIDTNNIHYYIIIGI